MTRFWRWIALAAVAAAAVAGCDDNDLGLEKRRPNLAPQTTLSSGPPDSALGTSYKVQLFWSGADADGTIDHYDYIMIDHAAFRDSINPADTTYTGTVMVVTPLPDDPRWNATTANDTLIVTSADTVRLETRPRDNTRPDSLEAHNNAVRARSYERWHTFFVRAVDNEGQIDPSPSYRSFNSNTIAPEVFLRAPVSPVREFTAPRVIVFNWDGNDPVGDGTIIEPIASRWAIVETCKLVGVYQGYPYRLYDPDVPWSIWRSWNAANGSGKQAIVRGLRPTDGSACVGYYMFAVQAMDEAGAVTPVFDATTQDKNNVALIRVTDRVGATLIVDEQFLGTYRFTTVSRPVVLDVAAGQPIQFRFRGDASDYGGEIVAFRYGWNIRNPDNDQEWEQQWCATCRSSAPRIFNSGTQRFFVEIRDNAETVTHAEIELVVNQVTRTRDLLLIDDSIQFSDTDETEENRRWFAVIDSLDRRQNFDFRGGENGQDYYPVARRQNKPPPLSLVFNYKTIIWFENPAGTATALRTVARFFDPFVSQNQNAVVPFNFLNVYIDNGGEFWLSGEVPTEELWTFGQAPLRPYPINITNWDDYVEMHPDEDSVGVRSFLWKLGVEAVDHCGGSRTIRERDGQSHRCKGFRRATPPGYEKQEFETSTVENHTHKIVIRTGQVDSLNLLPGGVTYTTTSAVGHTHRVTLTQADLQTLARGGTLPALTTDDADMPSVHNHTLTNVRDRIGLWGAPQQLFPQSSLWAQPVRPEDNPTGGRPNVEIYNMPTFLTTQSPPLRPDPDVWEGLYYATSSVPVDPTRNFSWPSTGDGQASVILRKALPTDVHYSRALCGFGVWRLQPFSHLALADNILLRHFRLGLPDGQ